MHQHSHSHSIKNIKLAFFLNLSFTLIEIIGGILTNSMSIIADAIHDLGDSLGIGLSWYLEKVSKKGRDSLFSYGYKRFSLLSALMNAIVLLIGSLIVLWEAIPRIWEPEAVEAQGMFYLAILGVIVNGLAAYKTSHGQSMNEKMVSLHLLEDVLGWLAVLCVSIVLLFYKVPLLDTITSILITFYILWNVGKNLKKVILLFLQSVPEEFEIQSVENSLLKIQGVISVHNTHLWSLDGEQHILTTHIVVKDHISLKEKLKIKNRVKETIQELGQIHLTLEIEEESEICELENC